MLDKNNWIDYYNAPDRQYWNGRTDNDFPERFHQAVKLVDLLSNSYNSLLEDDKYTFVIIGFACDEGVKRNQGRVGAKDGPDKIRSFLAGLPFNYAANINIFDVGNIYYDHDNFEHSLEGAQQVLGDLVEAILLAGCHPIVLGGGHETAWGHYQGIANTDYTENLGIINFDAHFDLRPLLNNQLGTSGTPFTQIAQTRRDDNLDFDYFCIGIQPMSNTLSLYEEADALGVEYIEASELTGHSIDEIKNSENFEKFINFIEDHESLYVSICLDVFISSSAPGVSAPQPFGLMPQVILPFLQVLAQSNKVVSLDIVELAPNYDIDNMTARLGAHLLANYIDTACASDA